RLTSRTRTRSSTPGGGLSFYLRWKSWWTHGRKTKSDVTPMFARVCEECLCPLAFLCPNGHKRGRAWLPACVPMDTTTRVDTNGQRKPLRGKWLSLLFRLRPCVQAVSRAPRWAGTTTNRPPSEPRRPDAEDSMHEKTQEALVGALDQIEGAK